VTFFLPRRAATFRLAGGALGGCLIVNRGDGIFLEKNFIKVDLKEIFGIKFFFMDYLDPISISSWTVLIY